MKPKHRYEVYFDDKLVAWQHAPSETVSIPPVPVTRPCSVTIREVMEETVSPSMFKTVVTKAA